MYHSRSYSPMNERVTFCLLLAHMSHELKVSFCDPLISVVRRRPSVIRPSVNSLLQTTSPPKQLDGISPHWMAPFYSCSKIAIPCRSSVTMSVATWHSRSYG